MMTPNSNISRDLDAIIHRFETKWGKRLGELAILIYLSRKKEGAHAYELRTKVEGIIFANRKEREKILEELTKLVEKLVNLQKIDNKKEYKDVLIGLKEDLSVFPFLFQNKYVQALFDSDSNVSLQDSFTYFSELLELMHEALKELRSYSLLWSSISGIYPTIRSLEKDGLIILHRTEQHEGRLRKIYTITEIGQKALQRAISSLLEITAFMFQIEKELILSSDYDFPREELSAMRKLFVKFREGLQLRFDFHRNIRDPFLRTPILNLILPPELRADFSFATPFMDPDRIRQILASIDDEVQKKIIASNFKNRFEVMQKRIIECLELLEDY